MGAAPRRVGEAGRGVLMQIPVSGRCAGLEGSRAIRTVLGGFRLMLVPDNSLG